MTKPEYANRLPILLYGKSNCQQCRMTERKLTELGIPFKKIDVEVDAKAYDYVVSLGYQQVPVVFIPFDWDNGGAHWSGYQPELLAKIG